MRVAELIEAIKKDYLDFRWSSQRRVLKQQMAREIERFSQLDHRDKAAYPDDWEADRNYRDELKKKGKKLPRSRHTRKFERMYGK